jgi:hypothetical protein
VLGLGLGSGLGFGLVLNSMLSKLSQKVSGFVFFVKWSHVRGTYSWSFVTQICHSGQPSRGCDRKTFEVMTNVHAPNRFAHKERIWYDYICPNKKEEKTQTTSRHEIIKGE